jgi:hypothetical protein
MIEMTLKEEKDLLALSSCDALSLYLIPVLMRHENTQSMELCVHVSFCQSVQEKK